MKEGGFNMPKQLMYVNHETNEVMTGREARKRYRKRYAADPELKYFDVSYYAQDDVSTETIQGIACQRKGKVYTFTVPGWDECSTVVLTLLSEIRWVLIN